MKISEILSEVDSKPISTHATAAMLVGYVNNELALSSLPLLTSESTGAEAIAAIYRLPPDKQDLVFQKDFTSLRKKDSYKFTVLALSSLAVVACIGYAGTIARLEGEAGANLTDIFKLLITGLFEVAKLVIPALTT